MNFFKKIFGCKKNEGRFKAESQFSLYRSELAELNLSSFDDLEKLVKPIIKRATKIIVDEPSIPPENSQLNSHFGGQPYFENDEEWPKSNAGRNLDFVFQIFNEDDIELSDHIKLVQFYYDFEEFPWDTDIDGWFVKIYENLNKDQVTYIPKPSELDKSNYCEVLFEEAKSLPDWEEIGLYHMNASKLSCVLNEDEPWVSYGKVVEKLIGEQNYQSQLGGYPKWIQGESTPKNDKGVKMDLLFQIDSEDNAGLMWGDVGLVYVFYDKETKRIGFSLQCH